MTFFCWRISTRSCDEKCFIVFFISSKLIATPFHQIPSHSLCLWVMRMIVQMIWLWCEIRRPFDKGKDSLWWWFCAHKNRLVPTFKWPTKHKYSSNYIYFVLWVMAFSFRKLVFSFWASFTLSSSHWHPPVPFSGSRIESDNNVHNTRVLFCIIRNLYFWPFFSTGQSFITYKNIFIPTDNSNFNHPQKYTMELTAFNKNKWLFSK